jgi:hypothetical protein
VTTPTPVAQPRAGAHRWRLSPRTTAGVVAVAALALTACSSSSGGTPAATKATKAADLALARKGLVVVGDLPSGWTATGAVTSGGNSGNGVPTSKIAACLGVAKSEINNSEPTENSPTFNGPQGAAIDDEVEAFPNTAKAKVDFSTFSNAKTPGCVTTVLGPLLRQSAQKGSPGTTVGTITATREPFAGVGDNSGEIELHVPISVSGTAPTTLSLDIDLVVITQGRLESTLSFDSQDAPLDQALVHQTAAAAVRHMS